MSLVFPLSCAEFMDRLPIQTISLDCPERVEMSGTARGEIFTADVGPRLWTGQVTLGRMTRAEAADAGTLLSVLRGAGRSFLVYDPAHIRPRAHPAGPFGAPVIAALPADSRQLALAGLPGAFMLRRGDYLAFTYGSSPIRYALHRVVDDVVVADGTGATPSFEVVPNIRPGAAAGMAVTLDRPACKAIIMPASYEVGETRSRITEGSAFSFIQTLR